MALPDSDRDDEQAEVVRRRYREARDDAHLSMAEAKLFAESNMDIGLLRLCVNGHCPPELMAKILV